MTAHALGGRGLAVAILLTGAGFAASLAAPGCGGPAPLLLNESASVPRGLYLRRPAVEPELGVLVAAPQPRGPAGRYLQGLGAPAGMRLLKRVAAVGGDAVCATPGALTTPRGVLPVAARDRRGTALPAWRGCRRLAPDELLLLGDTAASFDGRYFGPVRRRQVEGVYVEVLRW